MLKLAGETNIGLEKIETLTYNSYLQDTGDLEAATKTITATTKPATADYTHDLTIPSPSDGRVVVTNIGIRGNIHIDSFGGPPAATKVYCTIEIGGVEVISAVELTNAAADNFFGANLTTTQFPVGSAQTIGIFLWADQGDAVISVAQIWASVGTYGTSWMNILEINHAGFIAVGDNSLILGSGSISRSLKVKGGAVGGTVALNITDTSLNLNQTLTICAQGVYWRMKSSVATDLAYIYGITAVLRGEQ